jgi:VCBS repeat-containing protein
VQGWDILFVPNRAPVAGISFVGTPNGSTGVVIGQVVATDPDANALTFASAPSTAKGTVVVNANGSFVYTPTNAARYAAAKDGALAADKADAFTVTISDGNGGTAVTAVDVAVAPLVNRAPVSGPPSLIADASSGIVTGNMNVSDPNNDMLTYTVTPTTATGTVTVNSRTGTFTYTPTAAARHAAAKLGATVLVTTDTFTLTASDGYGGSITIPVRVSVSPSNTGPTATTTSAAADASTGKVTGTVIGTDAEGDTLTYRVTSSPSKGGVTVNAATGGFDYTPTSTARHTAARTGASDAKSDTFTVTISDGYGGTLSRQNGLLRRNCLRRLWRISRCSGHRCGDAASEFHPYCNY